MNILCNNGIINELQFNYKEKVPDIELESLILNNNLCRKPIQVSLTTNCKSTLNNQANRHYEGHNGK